MIPWSWFQRSSLRLTDSSISLPSRSCRAIFWCSEYGSASMAFTCMESLQLHACVGVYQKNQIWCFVKVHLYKCKGVYASILNNALKADSNWQQMHFDDFSKCIHCSGRIVVLMQCLLLQLSLAVGFIVSTRRHNRDHAPFSCSCRVASWQCEYCARPSCS